MQEEFFAEIDSEDNVLGIHPKSSLREKNFRHRIAIVLPKGKENTFFFSRRAKDKFPFPDTWMFAIGGKVRSDETYEEAARREMKEEVGLQVPLEYIATSKLDLPTEKAIVRIYMTKEEVVFEDFVLDFSEIQKIKAFSIEEMSEIIDQTPGECAPTFRYHFAVFRQAYLNSHRK